MSSVAEKDAVLAALLNEIAEEARREAYEDAARVCAELARKWNDEAIAAGNEPWSSARVRREESAYERQDACEIAEERIRARAKVKL